jgi:hypothetical protein
MRRALAHLLLRSPIASVVAFIFVRNSILDALKKHSRDVAGGLPVRAHHDPDYLGR